MKQYKGYYIDKVIFNNREEIDRFLEEQAVEAYTRAVELFVIHSTVENSVYCDEKAQVLVDQFGYSWEQVEALEIKTLQAGA